MQLQQTLSIALLSLLLVACGGSLEGGTDTGGTDTGGTDTGGTVTAPADMTASLFYCPSAWNQDITLCTPTTEISETQSGVVVVSLSQDGVAVASEVLKASVTKGALQSNSALTNSSGMAFFTIISNNDPGAGSIKIETEDGATSSSLNFQIAVPTGGTASVPVDMTVLLLDCPDAWDHDVDLCTETTHISAVRPGVVAVSLNQNGSPLATQIIDSKELTLGAIKPASALTDANGFAYFTLVANNEEGAGKLTLETDAAGQVTSTSKNFAIGSSTVEITIENNLAGMDLAQNSTAVITVNLTSEGEKYTTPVRVTFSSACATAETAKLDASKLSIDGVAQATYQTIGCVGADVITANAEVNNLSASTTIVSASSPAHSIRYVGASPEWVAIKGTGGVGRQETSILTFQLVDKNGHPSSQQIVDFTLNNFPAGTTIEPMVNTTNSDGEVTTVISAGKVAGPVVISAKLRGSDPIISTVSDQVVVSTGLADQDSFTLALENFAPETWEYAGDKYSVTAYLADHENNTVPNGTPVSFQTEGGSIADAEGQVGACNTTGGECVVYWKAQNPKPIGNQLSDMRDGDLQHGCAYSSINFGDGYLAPCINTNGKNYVVGMGQPYAGRVTITSYAIGEESFVDNDHDGWFTDGDELRLVANDDGPVQDLPEVFFDYNEDGKYKVNTNAVSDQTEESKDFNPVDGLYSAANGIFNGVLCSDVQEAVGNCSIEPIHVRRSAHLIMASSAQHFRVQGTVNIDAAIANINSAFVTYQTARTSLNVALDTAGSEVLSAGTTAAIGALNEQLVLFDEEITKANLADDAIQAASDIASASATAEQTALVAVEAAVNSEVSDANEADAVAKTVLAEKAGVVAAKDALFLDALVISSKSTADSVAAFSKLVTSDIDSLVLTAKVADSAASVDAAIAALAAVKTSLGEAKKALENIKNKLSLAGFVDTNTIDLTSATGSGSVTVMVYIADENNNHPPTGSTFKISTTNGNLDTEAPAPLANFSSYGPIGFPVTLSREGEPNKKSFGTLSIKITTPKGVISSTTLAVSDDG